MEVQDGSSSGNSEIQMQCPLKGSGAPCFHVHEKYFKRVAYV